MRGDGCGPAHPYLLANPVPSLHLRHFLWPWVPVSGPTVGTSLLPGVALGLLLRRGPRREDGGMGAV